MNLHTNNTHRPLNANNRGFTLLELLVTIAVMVALIVGVFAAVGNYTDWAEESSYEHSVKILNSQINLMRHVDSTPPTNWDELLTKFESTTVDPETNARIGAKVTPELRAAMQGNTTTDPILVGGYEITWNDPTP